MKIQFAVEIRTVFQGVVSGKRSVTSMTTESPPGHDATAGEDYSRFQPETAIPV
jgi:hypothetical protein